MAWYLFRMRVSPRVSSLHSKQIPCHVLSVLFRPTNEFQTTRFNWIKPRPTRNQLTSTCLSTPFLIPFRIINLSPSINRRQRHRLHQNSLPSSSFSSVQSNLERIFFNDTIHTHTHYSKKLSSNPWISDKEQVPILRSTSTSSNLNENPLLETLHRGKRSYIKVNPLRLVRT